MTWRQYLLQFANEHLDFHLAELKSLCSLFDIKCVFKSHTEENFDKRNPFLSAEFATEECLRKLMSRTILIKSAFELWSEGHTIEELISNLKTHPQTDVTPYLSAETSFKVLINGFNKSYTGEQTMEKINYLVEHVGLQGPVNLRKPDVCVHLLEYYAFEGHQSKATPDYVYLGRWITDGQRDTVKKYDLKNRHFIGNTSMENRLSMIMSNMAQVKKNDMVFDPFVGTGSLLVAAAHFGGYVLGTDLDWNIIHGQGKSSRQGEKYRGEDENIRANLRFYGLEQFYIDAFVADASQHNVWRYQPLFDAIITDPPYGIREGTKKVGPRKQEAPIEKPDHAFPTKRNYHLSEVFTDLLNFSGKYLRMNGRLVFWLPVYIPEYVPCCSLGGPVYSDENVPQHPCFRVVSNCEQVMVRDKVARRLITMEKISHWEDHLQSDGATFGSDHYTTESFRERYFKTPEQHKKRVEKPS